MNGVVVAGSYLLDGNILYKRELSKIINNEKIDLIRPENKELLIEDLNRRSGLKIHRVAVERVDFLRDTARIRVYFYE